MNMTSSLDIYRTGAAYHESGHAVMAVCLGGTIIEPGVRIDDAWHCQARFFRLYDSLEREYTLVLNSLAGWRAEHLWHHRGSKTREEDDLRYFISEARDPEGEIDKGDDIEAFEDMLARTPDATDDELLARYRLYCDHCYAILNDPLIWSSVERLATSLIKRGNHDADAAITAMGCAPELLSDAAFGIRCNSIANKQLPMHHQLLNPTSWQQTG